MKIKQFWNCRVWKHDYHTYDKEKLYLSISVISYMEEGWNLSHPSCFMTLQFSNNCKGGSPSTLPHQRGRRVLIPPSLYRKATPQNRSTTWVHCTKASSLFLESPLSLLIREMLNPQKRRSLRKMTKFSCLIHVGQPMNPAHSSQVCTFIHTEMSDGIRLQIISLPSHLIQHIFQ